MIRELISTDHLYIRLSVDEIGFEFLYAPELKRLNIRFLILAITIC